MIVIQTDWKRCTWCNTKWDLTYECFTRIVLCAVLFSSKKRRFDETRMRNSVAYLSESHGCEPASAWFFVFESNDLDPGLSSLRVLGLGLGLGVTVRPQADAPLEGCAENSLGVRYSVDVIVWQARERDQMFAVLQQKKRSIMIYLRNFLETIGCKQLCLYERLLRVPPRRLVRDAGD